MVSNSIDEAFEAEALQGDDIRNVSSCHLSIICKNKEFWPEQLHVLTFLDLVLAYPSIIQAFVSAFVSLSLHVGRYLLPDLVVKVYGKVCPHSNYGSMMQGCEYENYIQETMLLGHCRNA